MKIITINISAASIKYHLYEVEDQNFTLLFNNEVQRKILFHDTLELGIKQLLESDTIDSLDEIDIFTHRIVHGGSKHTRPIVIDRVVMEEIRSLIPLAPLHNPASLDTIETIKSMLPNAKQVAVFDTSFHKTLPDYAYVYPLPYKLYENDNIRKYGFHGISHQHIAGSVAKILDKPLRNCNLITLHLGSGSSVCAIKNGKSIDTTMGFTPLEGIMMSTRSGDIDTGIIFNLYGQQGLEMKDIYNILHKKSGFKGIAGEEDFKTIVENAYEGDERSNLAVEMFAHKIKKSIGAYREILDHDVDAIVFTGGIGENSEILRKLVIKNINNTENQKKIGEHNYLDLTDYDNQLSNTKIFAIKSNEELELAIQTAKLIEQQKL